MKDKERMSDNSEPWQLIKPIGQGSYGEVFLAKPQHPSISPKTQVAIKYERNITTTSYLENEVEIYQLIKDLPNIPSMYHYHPGAENRYLVLELLGPPIKHLIQPRRRLRLSAVIELGLQMIDILQRIHSRSLAFRDVKPDNFLLSPDTIHPNHTKLHPQFTPTTWEFYSEPEHDSGERDELPFFNDVPVATRRTPPKLYIIDFGLTEFMQDPSRKWVVDSHLWGNGPAGTALYASLATHLGFNSGPLDDLESVGYVLLELLYSELPWESQMATCTSSSQRWGILKQLKRTVHFPDQFYQLPTGFADYFHHLRHYPRDIRPDYQIIRGYLERILTEVPPSVTSQNYDTLFL